jgi:hypothetical protein
LAPSGAGLLKVKVFWRQKARVVLRLKISGMIIGLFATISIAVFRAIVLSVVILNVVMLSVVMLNVVTLSVVMLHVVMLNGVTLSVVMLHVVMLCVMAP